MRCLLLRVFAGLVLAASMPAVAAELTRAQALTQLEAAGATARREAIARLGEVGTMPDVSPLLRVLRDPDEQARGEAERSIWKIWSRSGRPDIDEVYRQGVVQFERGDFDAAIGTFTKVIELAPDFAEGWNKRATLFFLTGELRRSLADCDEVLKRNPQHFGALAGYAQIHILLENYERALQYARRAAAVNPNMEGVNALIESLERVVEDRKGRRA